MLSLRHQHIARVRGHGRWPNRQDGYFYVVMDYVEGGTLARWCEDNRATAHEVLGLMDKVLEAVAFMHAQGIFHRDLKPGNILVSKGGKEPVVVDYGVAHFPMPALPQLTDTVLPPGTPRYTSPEALHFEAQNRRNQAARYEFTVADELYALGVTLYDLLTDPLPDSHPQPVALGIGFVPTPLAHQVNERVPVALSYFTAKLMAAEPGQRPVSAEAARRDEAELLQLQSEEWTKCPLHPPTASPGGVPLSALQAKLMPGQPVALRRWPRARAVAAGVAVLSALLACGVYLGLRSGAPAQPTPGAEEAPRPPSPAPSAKAEPLPALPTPPPVLTPPLPPPTPPVATPEKGTPMNTATSLKPPPPRCAHKRRHHVVPPVGGNGASVLASRAPWRRCRPGAQVHRCVSRPRRSAARRPWRP